jgi:protoporphyrinogen/coproporphyrinogen III oxidase
VSAPTTPSSASNRSSSVVVIGGGIAGLAAAWELTGGDRGASVDGPRVTVLEASPRLGGALRSEEFAGRTVDLGPDGVLGRRPEAVDLCRAVGLGDELVAIGASGASVWARGRLRPMPGALALGVPTRWWPVARSGVLGVGGSLRLARDALAPRPSRRGPIGDRALGPLVADKLGPKVVATLVDPLVGGINAGSVADMSTAAVSPALLAAAGQRVGLMRALRRIQSSSLAGGATESPTANGPAFWALERGLGSLVERLSELLVGRGVQLCTGLAAARLEREDSEAPPWIVRSPAGSFAADGVVLATPAPIARDLLTPHDAEAATLLGGIDHASVALVTLQFGADALSQPLFGTGFLVPRGSALPGVEEPDLLMTACTFLSQKWPHLARDGDVLLRASVGRFGDDRPARLDDEAVVTRVVDELTTILGLRGRPTAARVTRWPDAFPQYRVHHLLRVAGIEAAIRRLPALAVAGAAYRGVGVPACIASGRQAASTVLDAIAGKPAPAL